MKRQFLNSYTSNLRRSTTYLTYRCSSISKSSKHTVRQEPPLTKPAETTTTACSASFTSLFQSIKELLGSENLNSKAETPSGFSVLQQTHVVNSVKVANLESCVPPICENAAQDDSLNLEEASSLTGSSDDVSPLVNQITNIVRMENDELSMEERLEKSGFRFCDDVVEKVLKRCYKVPHLAFRFFSWVRSGDGCCVSTNTYNALLYIAGEAREFGVVEKLLEDMERSSCEKDFKTWTILAFQYGKAGLIGKACFAFERMKKCGFEPNTVAYRMMIRLLCSAKKADIALEYYKEMVHKDMMVELDLYGILLKCLAASGDVTVVSSIADDMISKSQIPEDIVYYHVLNSFCISRRITEALELIRKMKNKGLAIEPKHFKSLVKGLCRADKIEDALEIVRIMERTGVVDNSTYEVIIAGYLRENNVFGALDVFCNMKGSGGLPSTHTYTMLMQKHFRLSGYQKGLDLYNEMLETGIQPDIVAVTALVAGHVSQNNISEAWESVETMEGIGIKPNHKFYSVFIKELCKVGRTDEIFKVLKEMEISKIAIRDEVFKRVISHFKKKGELENVERVKQMQDSRKIHFNNPSRFDRPSSVELKTELNRNQLGKEKTHCLLPKPTPVHRVDDSKEICRLLSSFTNWHFIEETLAKRPVIFTVDLVLETLRNCKSHASAALQFFHWVKKQDGYRHTTETYNMAIKIAGSGKDFKHMRSLFSEMRRNNCPITSDTWTIMIMQYGRTGLTERALNIFKEMKSNGSKPTGSTYKFLLICLCGKKGRKVEDAIRLFQEMVRAEYIPDKELIETYLNCLCEANKLQEAKSCANLLHKLGFSTALSHSLYIRSLCRAGKLEDALRLMNEVESEKERLEVYVYGSIVHGLLKKGKLEDALSKINYMKLKGIPPTTHVYTSLIVHFFKEKQIEKALEILEKMQNEDCMPTVVTYSALLRGYMDMNKFDDAWNVFRGMQLNGPSPDFGTYSMFINHLCRVRRSEEALQLIHEMFNSGIIPSTVNFRTVFYGLNREGKQELAHSVLQKKWDLMKKRFCSCFATQEHISRLGIKAMRAIVQRVEVEGHILLEIGLGFLVSVGIHESGTDSNADYIWDLWSNDEAGLVPAIRGSKLQKMLYLKQPHNFAALMRIKYRADHSLSLLIADGIFGAMMNVNLVNDGPVAMQLDSYQPSRQASSKKWCIQATP